MAHEITKDNFDKVVMNNELPVLVDFWAPWCGPCKMVGPIVEEIASELEGKVFVGKVNVDDEQELAMKFGVMSIPTLMVFKNGQLVKKQIGFAPKAAILAMLE